MVENQPIDPGDLRDAIVDRDTSNGGTETKVGEATLDAGSRRGRRDTWLAGAVVGAAALFIGSVAFTGAVLQPHLADRAAVSARVAVARTAAAAITTLWTYTPDTIDTLADRASEYLSGDFAAQYRKFLEAAVMPNRQAQVTGDTNVVGVSVESLDGANAVAIVFTNTTATSPLTQNVPSLKYVSYRVSMQRLGSRWTVTNMATISFMDLTPKV